MAETDHEPAPFEVVLYPNPPMGRYGLSLLIVLIAAVSAGLGFTFAMFGAWPVSGFLGLDVLLLGVALRVAQRRSRRSQAIRLDSTGLHIRQTGSNGKIQNWRFEPYWVRLHLERRGTSPVSLWLRSHGKRLRLGDFLTGEECQTLAIALEQALKAYR